MARALNAKEFVSKQFTWLEFTGLWLASFGLPGTNFSMIIYGKSGNGKSEFALMFAKYMTRFGKVYYNSFEQGYTKSLQDAFIRQKLDECGPLLLLGNREKYAEMIIRLKKKKSPRIVFIDSVNHMKLSEDLWLKLKEMFPRKIFIMIAHGDGGEPKGAAGKAIKFDVEIKVEVKGYIAYPDCRYGGNETFMIWEKGHEKWLARQQVGKVKQSITPTQQPSLFTNEEKKLEVV
jgi:hypothetical protein